MFHSSYCRCFVPGLIRPSLPAGPSGTTEAMKIPRSSLPVLSSPTITKPETEQERNWRKKPPLKESDTWMHSAHSFYIKSTTMSTHQNPVSDLSSGSHRLSLSPVGSWLVYQLQSMCFRYGKWVTVNSFSYFLYLVGQKSSKFTSVNDLEFPNHPICMSLDCGIRPKQTWKTILLWHDSVD